MERKTWRWRESQEEEKTLKDTESETQALSDPKSTLMPWCRSAPEKFVDTPEDAGQVLRVVTQSESKYQNKSQAK